MEFICIVGDRGGGKTNILTKYLKDGVDSGRKVIANYQLAFKHRYMPFAEIRKLPPELNGALVGMDELGVGADSYEFFTKDSKDITTFVAEIRKRHCTAYYTVQRFSMIARRLRLLTDGFIFMEDLDRQNMVAEDGTVVDDHRLVCKGIFRATFCDSYMRVIRAKKFYGAKYWPMYNTDEIVRK